MTTAVASHASPAPAELLEEILSKPIGSSNRLRSLIGNKWKTISAMLPGHMTQDRFAALVMSAAGSDSNVYGCTGESILTAIYQAASLGLEINAATGEAYLIPYKNKAQLVPGYKGLVKLAIRSGEVRAIEARLVYQGEEDFRVFYGTDSRIEHRPNFDVKRTPAAVTVCYAVAKLASGQTTFELMTREQMETIRGRSPGAGRAASPWNTDTEEMYRKTVTRRLCKYLPMSPQLSEALELIDRADAAHGRTRETSSAPGGSDVLNAAIDAMTSAPPRAAAQPVATPISDAALLEEDRELLRREGGR